MENLIYSSAVLTLSQTTEVVRHKSIDNTIIHLIIKKGLSQFNVNDVYESIHAELPIRSGEIENAFIRMLQNDFIVPINNTKRNPATDKFSISKDLINKIDVRSHQIEDFLNEAVGELFSTVVTSVNKKEIIQVLLEALARLMAVYGYAFAGQLAGNGEAIEFVPEKELNKICKSILDKSSLKIPPELFVEAICHLFDRRDPCLNNLAFSICNSYYTSRLMGLDLPIDFISENIYKGSTIYLDTNFILSIAFSRLKQYNEFREILKRTSELGIRFVASELTIAEIHKRVNKYSDVLEKGEKLVPEDIITEVQEEIIHSNSTDSSPMEIDIKNSPHSERLRKMGVEIEEYNKSEMLFTQEELDAIMTELHEFDRKYRSTSVPKDNSALFHDAYFYFLINDQRRKNSNTHSWFLTRDNSVIQHSLHKKNPDDPPYAIKLLMLLQTLSQFIESQALKGEFADLFADLIAKDLLPKEQLFSINDLKMLVGFDIKAKAIPTEFIRKATHHVKTNILKGGGIDEKNKSLVVYEFVKYLATPDQNFVEIHKKYQKKLSDRDEDLKIKDQSIEDLKKIVSDLNSKFDKLDKENKGYKNKVKQVTINILISIAFLGISLLMWLNNFEFYSNVLNRFDNPFFFNLAIQITLIGTFLSLIYPNKQKLIILLGGLTTIGSIILSLV